MLKIELTKEEKELYDTIIKLGDMEAMFDIAYAIGRVRATRELKDELFK